MNDMTNNDTTNDATNDWKLAQFATTQFATAKFAALEDKTFESVTQKSAFFVASRQRLGRWRVTSTRCNEESGYFIVPRDDAPVAVGDAPDKLHPLYLAANVAARALTRETSRKNAVALPDLPIPRIIFSTDEATRRSMTLNGMRMSTEYFANGSNRVLELIENRLEIGQSDVVHNVLVYLMRRVFDIQAEAEEARDLRAEALSAFLGLDLNATRKLLSSTRPSARCMAQSILGGEAGIMRRKISDSDLLSLSQNQMQILLPQLRNAFREEEHVLRLVDEIVARLDCCNEPAA